jgi:hypothetical protein
MLGSNAYRGIKYGEVTVNPRPKPLKRDEHPVYFWVELVISALGCPLFGVTSMYCASQIFSGYIYAQHP